MVIFYKIGCFMKNNKKLPTKAQILEEIAKDFEQTDIKANKSEEDLFLEEHEDIYMEEK